MSTPRAEAHEDEALMARAAWLYYVAELNQEATAQRLGITRARVNKLLSDAREFGSGQHPDQRRRRRHAAGRGGDLRAATGSISASARRRCSAGCRRRGPEGERPAARVLQRFAFRGVGMAAAAHLKRHLQETATPSSAPAGAGRCKQMTLNLAGVSAPARPLHQPDGLADRELLLQPVRGRACPSPRHRRRRACAAGAVHRRHRRRTGDVLLSQRIVQQALEIARSTTVAYISIGELTETSLLRHAGNDLRRRA